MAYMSQERKRELAPGIKKVLAKYGMKGSIGVDNHSTLVVNIKSGKLDLIGDANRSNRERAERRGERFYEIQDYYQANPYRTGDYYGTKPAKSDKFLDELVAAMKGNKWYDKSDAMVDYFDTAWYLSINIGRWNKPYVYEGK